MVLFFYFFATLITISSVMVITSRNSVYCVLWLIFAFCNSAGLMVLLGAEFIAMMLIIIYVGAIAVLFLFVIMMLNINKDELYLAPGLNKVAIPVVTGLLLADLIIIILVSITPATITPADITHNTDFTNSSKAIITEQNKTESNVDSNVNSIARVLYTDFILPFQTSGIILLAAMIGSITLTRPLKRPDPKKPAGHYVDRNKKNSIAIIGGNSREGISDLNYDD